MYMKLNIDNMAKLYEDNVGEILDFLCKDPT